MLKVIESGTIYQLEIRFSISVALALGHTTHHLSTNNACDEPTNRSSSYDIGTLDRLRYVTSTTQLKCKTTVWSKFPSQADGLVCLRMHTTVAHWEKQCGMKALNNIKYCIGSNQDQCSSGWQSSCTITYTINHFTVTYT